MAVRQKNSPVVRIADEEDEDVDDVDLRLELDDDDDFAIVKGDYASVIFQNLAEKYPEDAHIECKYTLTRSYEPSARDWIGLYKVGWSSPRDYKTYEWVTIPEGYKKHENNVAKVMFLAHTLPEDDGEFYQFCYVGGGQVRGASVPFQFKSPRGEDFVEVEGDEDLMIVRTKTAVLQDNLDAAVKKERSLSNEKKKLETDKLTLEAKIKELDAYLEEKNEQVNDAEKLLEAREKELEEVAALLHRTKEIEADLTVKVLDLEKALQSKQEKIESLKDAAVEREMEGVKAKQELATTLRQKQEVEELLAEAKTALREQREELDKAQGMAQGLQKEKELYKTHFNSTEETLRTAHDEHQALKHLILVKESEIKTLREDIEEKKIGSAQEIEALKDAVDKEKLQSDKLLKKIAATQECVLHLQDKLANAKDRANAAEECKLMLDEQMKAYIAAYDGSAKDLVDARGQIHDLKDQIKKKDKLLSENAEANARLQTSLSEKEMEKEAAEVKIAALEVDRNLLLEEKTAIKAEIEQLKTYESCESKLEVDGATGEVSNNFSVVPPVDDSSSGDAALHALKMVISHLEKRLEKRDKQMKKLTKTCVDLEHAASEKTRAETELKKQVDDLKRRLTMGAEEYKKKYLECKKWQKKMEKIKKERCVPETDMETSVSSVALQADSATSPNVALGEDIEDMQTRMEKIKEKKNKFKKLYETECEKNADLRQEIESLRSLIEQLSLADETAHESCNGGEDVIMKQPSPSSSIASNGSATTSPPPPEKLRQSDAPSSPCLKPLPPPMIPVVLPTAKLSAARSFYELPPSPRELEATLLVASGDKGKETIRGAADGETGIPEDNVTSDNNGEEKEEFFLAPEPAQHSPALPPHGPVVVPTIAPSRSVSSPSSVATQVGPSEATASCVPTQVVGGTRQLPLATKRVMSTPQEHEDTPTVCEECSFVFPRDASDEFIASHIQEHAGRLCPVCSKAFPSEGHQDQKAFEDHVQSHFEGAEVDEDQPPEPASGFEFV